MKQLLLPVMKKIIIFLLLLIPSFAFAQDEESDENAFEYFELNPVTDNNGFPPDFVTSFNTGIRIYNKAVAIIDKVLEADDPTTVPMLEDQAMTLFKEALPHLEKAYSINKEYKTLLTALAGTYFGLNDEKKYKEFRKKAEK